jgi:hypothetical protein
VKSANLNDGGGFSSSKSTSSTTAEKQKAADLKLLAEAEALLEKQKARLEALEKQKAEAEASVAAEKAAAKAQKLADMKAAREADLAEKSRVRREAAGLPTDTGFWADRTGTSSAVPSSTGQTSSSNSSLTTSTYIPPDPTPTPATPATVSPAVVAAVVAPPVKTAPIDTVLFNDDQVPIEVMSDLIFEDIGGHELINIARNDIINGQDISYQPIKNLTSVQQQYNPNNILSVQSTSDKYFSNFAIKLENKVPNVGNGPFGSNVYLDTITGSLIIEAINLEADEQIEVEITLSGTIYEADLTGSEL